MRTTLLGALLDAARSQPRPRRRAGRAVRVRPRLPAARRRRRRRRPRRAASRAMRPAPIAEPHRIAALADRRRWRAAAGATAPRAADFFAAQGRCSRRSRRQLGVAGRARAAASEPVPASRAAPREVLVGGARRGLARRAPPARLPRSGTSSAPAAFELDLAPLVAASPRRRGALRGRDHLPGRAPGHRGGRRRGRRRPRRCATPCATAGGELLRGAEVFDLYRGEQVGEGRKSASRCGSSSARPTAPSPTRRSPSCASAIERRARARSGGRSVSERRERRVVVAGASGYAGALAAALVWRHPRLELAAVTVAHDAGTRLDDLYPRYRVPLELEELDLDAARRTCDAAIVAYPHGAAAPVVAALRERGAAGRRPLRRLPPARPRRLRALVRRARRARAARRGRLRAHRAPPRARSRERRAGRQPRLLPDRGAPRARAARRARG